MMDLVSDNGIFIEGNSPSAWFDGMTKMVKDEQLRKRMGIAARQTVERFYNADETWKLWLDVFEKTVAKKPIALEVA
jgi:glycosyltransferase involved in cell wall biosynthesis